MCYVANKQRTSDSNKDFCRNLHFSSSCSPAVALAVARAEL